MFMPAKMAKYWTIMITTTSNFVSCLLKWILLPITVGALALFLTSWCLQSKVPICGLHASSSHRNCLAKRNPTYFDTESAREHRPVVKTWLPGNGTNWSPAIYISLRAYLKSIEIRSSRWVVCMHVQKRYLRGLGKTILLFGGLTLFLYVLQIIQELVWSTALQDALQPCWSNEPFRKCGKSNDKSNSGDGG